MHRSLALRGVACRALSARCSVLYLSAGGRTGAVWGQTVDAWLGGGLGIAGGSRGVVSAVDAKKDADVLCWSPGKCYL